MELTKLMFREKKYDHPPFGLVENNNFAPQSTVITDASWFNRLGELLGRGPLSQKCVKKIVTGISQDVLFIIVPSGVIDQDEITPGKQCVAKTCRLILSRKVVYVVEPDEDHPLLARLRKLNIAFREIDRSEVTTWLVRGYPPIAP